VLSLVWNKRPHGDVLPIMHRFPARLSTRDQIDLHDLARRDPDGVATLEH
jgi:hypothetical protein